MALDGMVAVFLSVADIVEGVNAARKQAESDDGADDEGKVRKSGRSFIVARKDVARRQQTVFHPLVGTEQGEKIAPTPQHRSTPTVARRGWWKLGNHFAHEEVGEVRIQLATRTPAHFCDGLV